MTGGGAVSEAGNHKGCPYVTEADMAIVGAVRELSLLVYNGLMQLAWRGP